MPVRQQTGILLALNNSKQLNSVAALAIHDTQILARRQASIINTPSSISRSCNPMNTITTHLCADLAAHTHTHADARNPITQIPDASPLADTVLTLLTGPCGAPITSLALARWAARR